MKNSQPNSVWNNLFTRVEKVKDVPAVQIGVIGNCDVGKTSLVYSFLNKNFKLSPVKTRTVGTDI